ncbi:hypothetical protein EV702DRAFT_1045562 [Suillus placidus]|uniref:CxC1-like cysteine cluster associated with KDZ transposases domain-containing protein n=1 Tax=Suillus placidus TaxID=48579 RepID=A0A9P6ZV08_9AGAM|nr:hypothetical protein EV702DRAFT_1045562 [Suillus placidus]
MKKNSNLLAHRNNPICVRVLAGKQSMQLARVRDWWDVRRNVHRGIREGTLLKGRVYLKMLKTLKKLKKLPSATFAISRYLKHKVKSRNRTRLTTQKVRQIKADCNHQGLRVHVNEVYGPKALVTRAVKAHGEQRARLQAMSPEERRRLEALVQQQTGNSTFDSMDYGNDSADFDNILNGTHPIDISHAGGEFEDLAREIYGDLWTPKSSSKQTRRVDHRTRRDRIQRRVDAFDQQMFELTDTYLKWSHQRAQHGFWGFLEVHRNQHSHVDPNSGSWNVQVVDIFYALELYRVARLRNPHFYIQAYVKSICDLHGTVFHRYLSRQFSISFDLYLQLRTCVDSLVNAIIHRNSPDWCLRNACPCCTYELQNEPAMTFRLLYAMDGNDSLKRVSRRLLGADRDYLGPSIELPMTQWVCNDQYLSHEYVNEWANPAQHNEDSNMDDEKTKRSWGVYDETGVFVAMCRHGFCLLIADMVQSGELAKYPLSVVAKLLDAFGTDLGSGYDIGCLGLEDLETCEPSTLRYASVFHCQQLIAMYFEHNNEYEVYPSLGTFLHNNYKQALNILSDDEINLKKLMQDIHILDESVFERWLQEERDYLHGLRSEPEHETLQMEYWQKLVNLTASQNNLDSARSIWASATPASASFSMADAAATHRMETARRHTLELFEKDLTTVQELENKLNIVHRMLDVWSPKEDISVLSIC